MTLEWEDGGGLLTAKGASGSQYCVWFDSNCLSGTNLAPTYHETVGHARARAEHIEAERMRTKQGDLT